MGRSSAALPNALPSPAQSFSSRGRGSKGMAKQVSIKEQMAQASASEAQLLAAVASITPQSPPKSPATNLNITTVPTTTAFIDASQIAILDNLNSITTVSTSSLITKDALAQQPARESFFVAGKEVMATHSRNLQKTPIVFQTPSSSQGSANRIIFPSALSSASLMPSNISILTPTVSAPTISSNRLIRPSTSSNVCVTPQRIGASSLVFTSQKSNQQQIVGTFKNRNFISTTGTSGVVFANAIRAPTNRISVNTSVRPSLGTRTPSVLGGRGVGTVLRTNRPIRGPSSAIRTILPNNKRPLVTVAEVVGKTGNLRGTNVVFSPLIVSSPSTVDASTCTSPSVSKAIDDSLHVLLPYGQKKEKNIIPKLMTGAKSVGSHGVQTYGKASTSLAKSTVNVLASGSLGHTNLTKTTTNHKLRPKDISFVEIPLSSASVSNVVLETVVPATNSVGTLDLLATASEMSEKMATDSTSAKNSSAPYDLEGEFVFQSIVDDEPKEDSQVDLTTCQTQEENTPSGQTSLTPDDDNTPKCVTQENSESICTEYQKSVKDLRIADSVHAEKAVRPNTFSTTEGKVTVSKPMLSHFKIVPVSAGVVPISSSSILIKKKEGISDKISHSKPRVSFAPPRSSLAKVTSTAQLSSTSTKVTSTAQLSSTSTKVTSTAQLSSTSDDKIKTLCPSVRAVKDGVVSIKSSFNSLIQSAGKPPVSIVSVSSASLIRFCNVAADAGHSKTDNQDKQSTVRVISSSSATKLSNADHPDKGEVAKVVSLAAGTNWTKQSKILSKSDKIVPVTHAYPSDNSDQVYSCNKSSSVSKLDSTDKQNENSGPTKVSVLDALSALKSANNSDNKDGKQEVIVISKNFSASDQGKEGAVNFPKQLDVPLKGGQDSVKTNKRSVIDVEVSGPTRPKIRKLAESGQTSQQNIVVKLAESGQISQQNIEPRQVSCKSPHGMALGRSKQPHSNIVKVSWGRDAVIEEEVVEIKRSTRSADSKSIMDKAGKNMVDVRSRNVMVVGSRKQPKVVIEDKAHQPKPPSSGDSEEDVVFIPIENESSEEEKRSAPVPREARPSPSKKAKVPKRMSTRLSVGPYEQAAKLRSGKKRTSF